MNCHLLHSSPLFVSLCPSPALFHLAQHREGCFLSLVLGTDLITYLFSLSYSKLLWLCVLLRTQIFFPPLLLAAFQAVSPSAPQLHRLILCAVCCLTFLPKFSYIYFCYTFCFFPLIFFIISSVISHTIYRSLLAK